MTPIWSILICTIPPRKAMLNLLLNELYHQIRECNLTDDIEILWLTDEDGDKLTIGEKRQRLIEAANGKYVCFIDDDDWVATEYIRFIHTVLLKDPDVVGLTGIITVNRKQRTAARFIHSSRYKSYFKNKGVYYRPPNHLNPMLKTIAELVPFEYKSHGEDTDWAMALCKLAPYHRELYIEKPLYFYRYMMKPIWK